MNPSSGGLQMINRIVISIATAGGALAVAATAGGSVALTGPGTIRITDRLVKHIHVDGGPRGKGPGDQDFYRELLFNRGITPEPIGHSDITCTHAMAPSDVYVGCKQTVRTVAAAFNDVNVWTHSSIASKKTSAVLAFDRDGVADFPP